MATIRLETVLFTPPEALDKISTDSEGGAEIGMSIAGYPVYYHTAFFHPLLMTRTVTNMSDDSPRETPTLIRITDCMSEVKKRGEEKGVMRVFLPFSINVCTKRNWIDDSDLTHIPSTFPGSSTSFWPLPSDTCSK